MSRKPRRPLKRTEFKRKPGGGGLTSGGPIKRKPEHQLKRSAMKPRKTWMKRESVAHRQQRERLKPDRDSLKDEFPFCMVCGKRGRKIVVVHEIAKGHQHRWKAIELRSCQLVTCDPCNKNEMEDHETWPIERQLAAQKKHMPAYHDLDEFNAVRGRAKGAITPEQVEAWMATV